MSGHTNITHEENVFKLKYTTEFMRVPQSDEETRITRHPGSPNSLVRTTSSQQGSDHESSFTNPFETSSLMGEANKQDDVLSCPVCRVDYDTVLKRPILLPGCGHTFCSACVRERSVRSLECPVCRRSYPGATVESLPINFSLEALLTNKQGMATLQKILKDQGADKSTDILCPSHGIRLSFWCRTCEQVACGECLFDTHPADGHKLAKLQEVADEIREEAISTITVSHKDATKIFSRYLKDFVSLVENLQEAGKLMQTSRKLVAATACAEDFNSVTSVYETIKKVNAEIVELKLECEENAEIESVREELLKREEAESKLPEETKELLDIIEDLNKTAVGEDKVKVVDVQKRVSMRRHIKQISRSAKPSASAMYAMHTDGRLSKIQTEDYGLHVYSLSQYPSSGYSVAVRLGLLMEFIQRDKATVFLDFSHSGEKVGRVYIDLRTDMRRGLQFLHLCLGTLGPCYRGSRVDGICEKGAPGEYLRMGDYTGQSGQGGVGVVDGLEWGDRWTDSKKAGQVCGVGGDAGEKRFGSLFVLCTKDNPQDVFRCPFGEITRGMEVLFKLTKTEPVEAAYISDCGALVPIEDDQD